MLLHALMLCDKTICYIYHFYLKDFLQDDYDDGYLDPVEGPG